MGRTAVLAGSAGVDPRFHGGNLPPLRALSMPLGRAVGRNFPPKAETSPPGRGKGENLEKWPFSTGKWPPTAVGGHVNFQHDSRQASKVMQNFNMAADTCRRSCKISTWLPTRVEGHPENWEGFRRL